MKADLKLLETLLVAVGGALGMALLVYDKEDRLLYTNAQVMNFVNVPDWALQPGTGLPTLLALSWESRRQMANAGGQRKIYLDQDAWVEERMKIHRMDWYDQVERLGPNRWVRFIARRTLSGLGITIVLDVSDQKRQEQQWHADQERVRLTENILDSLPFPLFVKNRNLVYVAVNKAFCDLHGVDADSILGRTAWDLLDPDVVEQIEKEDRAVFETGKYLETLEWSDGPSERKVQTFTRKHRIGAPGNHLLVTTMDDVNKLAQRDIIRIEPAEAASPDLYPLKITKDTSQIATSAVDPVLIQRRVLVFLEDYDAASLLALNLNSAALEACAVANITELRQFLDMASSLSFDIAACLCDRYTGTEARTCLESRHILPVCIEDPENSVGVVNRLRDMLMVMSASAAGKNAQTDNSSPASPLAPSQNAAA